MRKNIKRLTRGNDIDYDERISCNEPYALEKYGEGFNRFYFKK